MTTSWVDKRSDYEAIIKSIDPSAQLRVKEGWFWEALGTLRHIVTFGKASKQDFLNNAAVAIGWLVYIPRTWATVSVHILYHEGMHIKRYRQFGLGIHPAVGVLPFLIWYVLLPLPILFAYGRFYEELLAESYAQIRMLKQHYYTVNSAGTCITLARHSGRQFMERVASGAYIWAWPKKWAVAAIDKRIYAAVKHAS